MKNLAISLLAMTALTGMAYADDARMSYKTTGGATAPVMPVTAVCSVSSSGVPQLCGDALAGSEVAGTDGRLSYKTTDGQTMTAMPVVPVCSVSSTGKPEICDLSGMGSNTTAGLIVGDENVVTANGNWPTTDPLVAGEAWQNGGVMMLSTGSAAAPTFDGSLLNVSAGGQTYTLQSWMGGLNYAAQTASTKATAAQTAADAAQTTANAAIPLTQKGAVSGVAALDANGNVTAPILTTKASSTGAIAVGGNLSVSGISSINGILNVTNTSGMATFNSAGTKQSWYMRRSAASVTSNMYTLLAAYNGTTTNSIYFYDTGAITTPLGTVANLGADAPFTGTVSAATLSASTSAFVPDTSTTDSTTAALNTESAAARFVSKTDAASFATTADLSPYLKAADAATQYVSATALSSYLKSSDAATTYAHLDSPALTGTPTAPTPATTDNSTNVATTAYVNNAFQAIEYSVQGDISTSGSSIQIPFGSSGLYAKFAYTGSGSASMTFYSTSGTLTAVDIRRNSIWGGSGVETFTLDNGSVGTSGVVADSTVYTNSQDSSAYFIRVGGQVYFLTVWASNSGARAFMGVHKMI